MEFNLVKKKKENLPKVAPLRFGVTLNWSQNLKLLPQTIVQPKCENS